MAATPMCSKCGFQFRGFLLPEMLGKMCPSCGAHFDGIVKYQSGIEVDITKSEETFPLVDTDHALTLK